MTTLAVPAIRLYWGSPQSAGAAPLTLIKGDPPPGQGALIQGAKPAVRTCSVRANVIILDAPVCSEKPPHVVGQKIGVPQAPCAAGTRVWAVTPMQMEVRRYAIASPAETRARSPAAIAIARFIAHE